FRRLGPGARDLFPGPVGREIRAHSRLWRSGRSTAKERIVGGEVRQGIFHLHRAGVFPRTAGGRAGSVPVVCQPGFAWKMKAAAAPDSPSKSPAVVDDKETGLPLLHSWPAVYFFVLGTFLLWILLLVAITRMFA